MNEEKVDEYGRPVTEHGELLLSQGVLLDKLIKRLQHHRDRIIPAATRTNENWLHNVRTLADDVWDEVDEESKPDREFEVEYELRFSGTVRVIAKSEDEAESQAYDDIGDLIEAQNGPLSVYDHDQLDVNAVTEVNS